MTPTDTVSLWVLLRSRIGPSELAWIESAVATVRTDRSALATLFPAVGRKVGRVPLLPEDDPADVHAWTVDDAGRVLLLLATGDGVWSEVEELYRFGDASERRAVLRAFPLLPPNELGLAFVDDAVRTNDPRLLAAALSPYAVQRLDDDGFNQAVLKCVFVGVPIAGCAGVIDRTTPGLSRMLAAYVRERVVAGRDIPSDVWPLVDAHPPLDELAALGAELNHTRGDRRAAAAAALAQRQAYSQGG